MKLVRFGAAGAEKPGLIDADGKVRDLSGLVPDLAGDVLGRESLARLRAIDPASLPLAPEGSRFGAPIKNLGLVMAYPEMAPLVRLVGADVALEILLEGRIFDAREAHHKGLVTRVVADDRVAAEALETAGRIADGAPLVARWHKRFARRLRDPRPLTEAEYLEGFDCFDTEDFRTGYQAFLAKTKPAFEGR